MSAGRLLTDLATQGRKGCACEKSNTLRISVADGVVAILTVRPVRPVPPTAIQRPSWRPTESKRTHDELYDPMERDAGAGWN